MTTATPVLAEGKTKILRPTGAPDEIRVTFKDAATAFNGKKYAEIPGKGELNARISARLFELLEQAGIPTCYVRPGEAPNELIYRPLRMIALEVVVRNVALGSIVKRFGLTEGTVFGRPLVECFYKAGEDPLISEDLIRELELIPPQTDLAAIRRMALQVNEVFVPFFEAFGVRCADFKLEFGLDTQGRLVLGDELSPDNFRLRDIQTGQVLDKDVFRLDLADLGDTYRELWRRMQSVTDVPGSATARRYTAEVRVHARRNILSPESRAILESLHVHGYPNIAELRAGKHFVLNLEAPTLVEAERQVAAVAANVLSNPVIEDIDYDVRLV